MSKKERMVEQFTEAMELLREAKPFVERALNTYKDGWIEEKELTLERLNAFLDKIDREGDWREGVEKWEA